MFFLSCSAELPILSPVYSFVPLALQNERTKRTTKEKRKKKSRKKYRGQVIARRMVDTLICVVSFLLLRDQARISQACSVSHSREIAFPPYLSLSFSPSVSLVLCFASFFARVSLPPPPTHVSLALTRNAIVLPISLLLLFYFSSASVFRWLAAVVTIIAVVYIAVSRVATSNSSAVVVLLLHSSPTNPSFVHSFVPVCWVCRLVGDFVRSVDSFTYCLPQWQQIFLG